MHRIESVIRSVEDLGDVSLCELTNMGNDVSIGSNVTTLPIDICDNVLIEARAVVTKSITKSGIYAGNPAVFFKSA